MLRFGSFTSSKSLTVAKRLRKLVTAIAADTSGREPATLGTYGPSNGAYIPGAIVISTANSLPETSTENNFVITGKNSLGNIVTTYTPNNVMGLFYVDANTMNFSGYGFNAFLSANAFGTIPSNYNDGAPIRDLINTNGVVTVEVSWSGMSAPFIINLASIPRETFVSTTSFPTFVVGGISEYIRFQGTFNPVTFTNGPIDTALYNKLGTLTPGSIIDVTFVSGENTYTAIVSFSNNSTYLTNQVDMYFTVISGSLPLEYSDGSNVLTVVL